MNDHLKILEIYIFEKGLKNLDSIFFRSTDIFENNKANILERSQILLKEKNNII